MGECLVQPTTQATGSISLEREPLGLRRRCVGSTIMVDTAQLCFFFSKLKNQMIMFQKTKANVTLTLRK